MVDAAPDTLDDIVEAILGYYELEMDRIRDEEATQKQDFRARRKLK